MWFFCLNLPSAGITPYWASLVNTSVGILNLEFIWLLVCHFLILCHLSWKWQWKKTNWGRFPFLLIGRSFRKIDKFIKHVWNFFFQQITGSGDFFVMRFWAVNSFSISGFRSYSKDLLHMGPVVAAFHYLLITPSHGPNLLFQWYLVGCSNHNTPHLLTCSFSRPKGGDPYPLYIYTSMWLWGKGQSVRRHASLCSYSGFMFYWNFKSCDLLEAHATHL